MGTVAIDGEFAFILHSKEEDYEPPHVHVRFGGVEVRINLDSGEFMDEPPGGKRKAIRRAYRRHLAVILDEWARLKAAREGRE